MRQREAALLHRKLDLAGLMRWDRAGGQWVPAETPSGPLVLLHLWAVECPPCQPELAELRLVLRSLTRQWPIKVVIASETLDQKVLSKWLMENQERVPEGEQYQNADGKLRRVLQDRTWPMTLLLDQDGVVRHAFVGSIAGRLGEFRDVVDRLAQSVRLQPLAPEVPAGKGRPKGRGEQR
jgi:hypothetical protein